MHEYVREKRIERLWMDGWVSCVCGGGILMNWMLTA